MQMNINHTRLYITIISNNLFRARRTILYKLPQIIYDSVRSYAGSLYTITAFLIINITSFITILFYWVVDGRVKKLKSSRKSS